MSSFLSFVNTASSVLSGVMSALGGNVGDGCIFALSAGASTGASAGGSDEAIELPVTPGSFEVTNPYNNSTVNVNALGDINMIGKRGLATLKFESFFPAQDYSFIQTTSVKSPYEYVSRIKSQAESGKPCKIAISGTDVSMNVTIEEFTYSEKDGTGDVYFSLSLKEYRYITPQSEQTNEATGMKSRVAETGVETSTTATTGMNSMNLAQKSLQKTTTIAKQGIRSLQLYKTLVKSGGLPVGTILTTTAKGVSAGGKSLLKF